MSPPARSAAEADPLAPARAALAALRATLRTVSLATATPEGEPAASVAPVVLAPDGAFFCLLSGLAVHTRHLRANPRAAVLVLDERATDAAGEPTAGEGVPEAPFARRRLTFSCAVTALARDTPATAEALQLLRAKFGAIVDQLAGLPDFQVFRLVPEQGRLVLGFGRAFDVDPRDWTPLQRIGPGA